VDATPGAEERSMMSGELLLGVWRERERHPSQSLFDRNAKAEERSI
jgi:hypothetical protein